MNWFRSKIRVIGPDDQIDGVAIIGSPNLLQAFQEANAYLDQGQGHRGVVWVPPENYERSTHEDIYLYLLKYGRDPRSITRHYTLNDVSDPSLLGASVAHIDSLATPGGNFIAYPNGLEQPADLAALFNDPVRRCIHVQRGIGTVVYPTRLALADIDQFGRISKEARQKLGEPRLVPSRGALIFNHYGLIEDRVIHAASDLRLSRPSWFTSRKKVIRRLNVWDYDLRT